MFYSHTKDFFHIFGVRLCKWNVHIKSCYNTSCVIFLSLIKLKVETWVYQNSIVSYIYLIIIHVYDERYVTIMQRHPVITRLQLSLCEHLWERVWEQEKCLNCHRWQSKRARRNKTHPGECDVWLFSFGDSHDDTITALLSDNDLSLHHDAKNVA